MSGPDRKRSVRQSRDSLHLCTFSVGPESFAVDVMRVAEIVPPTKVTAVPGAPAFVEGVIDLHGAMVPLIDLRRRFGMPAVVLSKKAKHLICRLGPKRIGLVVDAVRGNLRVARSAVKRAPEWKGAPAERHFAGMVSVGGSVVLLLNVKSLVVPDAPNVPDAQAQTPEQR